MAATAQTGDALTRALADSESIADGAVAALAVLGRAGGWRAGLLWLDLAGDGLLRAVATWATDEDARRFTERSARLALPRGNSLLGRAWTADTAVAHEDLLACDGLVRHADAQGAGLGSAVLAPLASVGRTAVGVVELLGDGPREIDEAHRTLVAIAGRQLAQFVLRVQAEEGRRSEQELRGAIVAAALDCIVTADHHGAIIDFNPAAEATFGISREDAIGQQVGDLIVPEHSRAAHAGAMAHYQPGRPSAVLNRRLELEATRADGTVFPAELTVTRLGTSEPPVFAGFIRDLTERRRAEAELAEVFAREHEARLRAEAAERATRRIADALQRSLLPPHLPAIDGIELAAAYRAGSDQVEVGGDFYDVFALSPDRWGIVIGDVCGKGPEAAAITALARYAVRTAAVRERSPAAVLRVLNEALLRDTGSEAFCTAVYATLDLAAERPVLCLSVAGHPPPLVLRASGEVHQPAPRGTLLGVMPAPPLVEREFELGPGDLLLLYTDGLIEGKTSTGRLGVEGLIEVLRQHGASPASSLTSGIEAAVEERAGRSDDDVAILAVRAAGGPATVEHAERRRGEAGGGNELVSLSLPAEPASVPEVRRAVGHLAGRALDPAACHRVATAVTEATANVVVHAYRDAAPGSIDVTARLEQDELVVLIEDGGSGVRAREDSPGLGLGLPLIRHSADEVDVTDRDDGGASVRMRFRRTPA